VVLRVWLAAHEGTHVAMESTGVYWTPAYYVLESHFTCLLVNAAHIKQLPGRKTDVKSQVRHRRAHGKGGPFPCAVRR